MTCQDPVNGLSTVVGENGTSTGPHLCGVRPAHSAQFSTVLYQGAEPLAG